MISFDNLKELVIKNIEDTGYLNQIRAQLKLQVYKIVENQDEGIKQQNGFQWQHPLTSQLQGMDHGVNSLELMIEYLEFFKLDYTAQVLRKEAHMKDIIIRESLGNRIGLYGKQDSMRPLLIIILGEFLKAVTEGYSPVRKNDSGLSKIEKKSEIIVQPVKPNQKEQIKEPIKQAIEINKPSQPIKQIEKKNEELQRPQTAPSVQPKKEPPSAVNKIRGAKQGTGSNLSNLYGFDMNNSKTSNIINPYEDLMVASPAQNDPYAFDLDAKTSTDPYAFDLDAPMKSKTGKAKQNLQDFNVEEDFYDNKKQMSKNKYNSNANPNNYEYETSNKNNNKNKKGKQEVEEDIDDFMESRDDKKQSNGMFTSSEDMMRATQSMGVDESVDSLALEDYDYYEDVTKKR